MSMPTAIILALAFTAIDDDLRELRIPPNAVERPRRLVRPRGRVNAAREYFVGDERIASREFYDNGRLAEEMLYRRGKLHGVSRQFYLSGKLYAERPYRAGVMDGEFRFWDEDGSLMGSSRIEKGTGLLREFDQPHGSSTDAETPYRNGRIHGHLKKWGTFLDCDGIGYQSSTYIDGRLEGLNVVRHGDGLLLSWSFYKNGELNGAVTHVKRDGQVAEGYPEFFLNSKNVTEAEMKDAADKDPELARSLKFRPPAREEVPERPSQAFARKKAAEKAKAAEKTE